MSALDHIDPDLLEQWRNAYLRANGVPAMRVVDAEHPEPGVPIDELAGRLAAQRGGGSETGGNSPSS